MFTASRKNRTAHSAYSAKSTFALIAVLVAANLIALVGLGVSAHADGFPNAMRYAPTGWEKSAPFHTGEPGVGMREAETENAASAVVRTVDRGDVLPVVSRPERNFVEIRTEQPAPTTASIARAGDHHRVLLIALMSIALATMAGVSVMMFRSLARDIAENERKRIRF